MVENTRRSGFITVSAPKWWLTLFALLTLVPWCLFLALNPPAWIKDATRSRNMHAEAALHHLPSKRGPWGELSVVRIVTEPPEESLSGYLLYPPPIWHFKGYHTTDFAQLLVSAGLSPDQKAELERSVRWLPAEAGCDVTPSNSLVLGLSPESRAVLYGALSLFPENTFQNEPFRFNADIAGEWFDSSGVSERSVELVRRLTYRRGKTLLFSDPHLVLPQLGSDLERVRLLKTLSRQSTLMVQLHVGPETDIVSLVSYWASKDGRAKDIKPLLQSAARIPGGYDIDITHLLPRFARKRIYTYPSAEGDQGEMVFDCHWNSMNFWNDPPDNRFSDNRFVIDTLESQYEPVLDAYRFGDIILFMKSNTQAIHSAVFIADDIVFTKNGPSQHSPWILMKLDTLVSHYETNTNLMIRGYRKKAKP